MSVPSTAQGLAGTDFIAAQRRNRRLTRWLLYILTSIAMGLGALIGAVLVAQTASTEAELHEYMVPVAIFFALLFGLFSLIWTGISLAFGDRMLAGIAGAKEATREEEPQLHNIVEEMAIAAGLPKPRVLVIETEIPNAFATGLRTSRSAIGVTRGLLNSLTRSELQGVIGHEMGHIANLDTRYMTIVGVTVGLIALVSELALRGLSFGRSSNNDKKGGGLAAILIVFLIVFAILAPIAAKLVQFAVSRQREYLADATSVQFTRNPEGLIGALRKLTEAAKPFPGASGATQHLFIVNPVRQFTSKTWALFATHPALEDRIKRLQNLGA
ncbi:MAG: M48 family metallopeptidase [Alphaproteobacteria bacterium]|nr:M48 family metallopeptidase [Alphaproteobacteria bacterium]